MDMTAFHTRGRANEGLKMPLVTPDGKQSEHWLRICGIDSDAFRATDARIKRQMLESIEQYKGADLDAVHQDLKRELIASLVTEWSFDAPCTPQAVAEFFREAPQIMDAVDRFASRRSLFFASAPGSSAPTQSTNSAST